MQKRREEKEQSRRRHIQEAIDWEEHLQIVKRQEVMDAKLYSEGKLGVACSTWVLFANIDRITKNPEKYLLKLHLDEVIETPQLAGVDNNGERYEIAYLPEEGTSEDFDPSFFDLGNPEPWQASLRPDPKPISVIVRGISVNDGIERAKRNLAYKILTRKATHGVDYKCRVNDDYVAMSAIPIILTRE